MLVLVAFNPPPSIAPVEGPLPIAGELVVAPFVEPLGVGDGGNRSWIGVISDGRTPTAMIARRPGISHDQLRDGFGAMFERSDIPVDDLEAVVQQHVIRMSRILIAHPLGTVLVRDGDLVSAVNLDEAA